MGSSSAKRNSLPASRRHRLSDGLHSIASSLSLWQGEMTAEQQNLQHQQHPAIHLYHFQHHIRSDYGSDSVGLNTKLRHYSLTDTTNFGVVRKSMGNNNNSGGSGGGSGTGLMMALPARQINGRSSSYGSLQ
ncbi:uncharacterized protein LOC129759994 [Uranotaenia lowii]|uniref:uncharacterized protein LOC129759994 n=1 Tax=Uranotaenia lowii TaxID=190385 RepID=UPI0024784578|nr:uncharacterized protein LOC129759994 [Uranotaenia lowii]